MVGTIYPQNNFSFLEESKSEKNDKYYFLDKNGKKGMIVYSKKRTKKSPFKSSIIYRFSNSEKYKKIRPVKSDIQSLIVKSVERDFVVNKRVVNIDWGKISVKYQNNYSFQVFMKYENGNLKKEGRMLHRSSFAELPDRKYNKSDLENVGIFKDNIIKYGEWITYYPDGSIKTRLNYKNDILHGTQRAFWENGKIARESKYDNGKIIDFSTTTYTVEGKKDKFKKIKTDKKFRPGPYGGYYSEFVYVEHYLNANKVKVDYYEYDEIDPDYLTLTAYIDKDKGDRYNHYWKDWHNGWKAIFHRELEGGIWVYYENDKPQYYEDWRGDKYSFKEDNDSSWDQNLMNELNRENIETIKNYEKMMERNR
tara:strand:- start:111 stop:1205 length:1095 start_codon:yes stop_codon:yes gene_type:complete